MRTVEEGVKHIVAEQLGMKVEEIANDASFTDDMGADSLAAVELTMALEEEFNSKISDEEAENLTTVQTVIDYIEARSTDVGRGTATVAPRRREG